MSNKVFKKIVKISLYTISGIILFITSAILLVYANQDKITNMILKEINEKQDGHLVVKEIHIAPFRNFPYISIELDTILLYSDKNTSNPAILSLDVGYIGFDVADLIKGNYTLKKVVLESGYIDYVKFEDGSINFSFTQSEEEEEDSSGISLDLSELVIRNINFKKTDHQNNQFTEFDFDFLKAKISYRKDIIDIHIDGVGDLHEFVSKGEHFFDNKHMEVYTDIHYNSTTDFLKIDKSIFVLENSKFEFEGTISDITDSIYCNIDILGHKSNFDLILAFAPTEYTTRLKTYKNEGEIYFRGKINGNAGDGETPKIDFEFGCANANFLNPNEKAQIKDLNFKGFFTNGKNRCLETSELAIRNLSVNPDNSTFKGSFRIKNFLAPLIFVDIHSVLDLEVLTNFYPVEGIEDCKGLVEIEMTLDELIDPDSAIVVLSKLKDGSDSRIVFKNVSFKPTDYPHYIRNINGEIDLAGDKVLIDHFNLAIKSSDLSIKGEITHFMSLFHKIPAPFELKLTGNSRKLNLKELLAHDQELAREYDDRVKNLNFQIDFTSTTESLNDFKYIPVSNLSLKRLSFETEKYPHRISEIIGTMDMCDSLLKLKSLTFKVGQNDLYISANIKNAEALFEKNVKEDIYFDTKIKSNILNLKELLVYDGKSLTAEEIKEETIKNFLFEGSGSFVSNSFCPNGFKSKMDIRKFQVQLNDFPKLSDVKGSLQTNTEGTVYIKDFYAQIGKSDIYLDFELLNYLDSNLINKNIKGTFKSRMLDFDDLLHYNPKTDDPVDHDSVFNIFALPFPNMLLDVDIQKVKHHKYLISDIKGRVRSNKDHYVYMDNVSFAAADGKVAIDGYFNGSNKDNIYLTSTVKLENLDLDKIFYKFDNFGQDYMINENLHGLISANIKSKVLMHPDFVADLAKTTATADVTIKEGRLVNFAPFHAMADYFGDKNLDNVRFGELTNTFEIRDGYISFPSMKMSSTLGYFYISGKQDFDLNMDYEVKIPLSLIKQAGWSAAKSKLKKKPIEEKELEEKEEEIIDKQSGLIRKYITFTIQGNSENFNIGLGKKKK